VHHVGILYDQFMMHGQRNIKSHSKIHVVLCQMTIMSVSRGLKNSNNV